MVMRAAVSVSLAIFLLLATTIATTCHGHNIYPLRLRSGDRHHEAGIIDCLSWRLAVETYNIQSWEVVPEACENYVGNYMLGGQYRRDCDFAGVSAYNYSTTINVTDHDVWVFDIDETALSNLPYYATQGFGADEFNETSFEEWKLEGKLPAVPATLELYEKLVGLGIKIVFLSGTSETYRNTTETNLKDVGYTTWEKLVLKQKNETGTAIKYKSYERTKLVEEGYRIVGNMGDQWSDLLGKNTGLRTFKVPDPMYYIP